MTVEQNPNKLEQEVEQYLLKLQCEKQNCMCKTSMNRHCLLGGHSNNDDNPSLKITINSNSWIQFTCWSAHKKMRPAILKKKIDEALLSNPATSTEYVNTPTVEVIQTSDVESLTVTDYLKERNLTDDVKKEFKLRDTKAGITMPYLDAEGSHLATRIRKDNNKKWKKGDKSHHPYGLHLLDSYPSTTITVVEGESDTHTVWDNRTKLGAVLGSAGSPHAIHKWDINIWESFKEIRVAVDYGYKGFSELDAGAKALIDGANTLPAEHRAKVKLMILPEPYKDISDLVSARDAGAVAGIEYLSIEDYVNQTLLQTLKPLYDLEDKNVINHFRKKATQLGLLADVSQMIFHVLESTNSDDPLALVVKGASGSGKNYHVNNIIKFVPSNLVINYTSASVRAMFYDKEDYRHKVLYKAEAGFEDPEALKIERNLISEKEIKHKTVIDGVGYDLHKEGPIGFITTTTNPKLYHDNETRVMAITLPNDKRYLDKVKKEQFYQSIQPFQHQIKQDEVFTALYEFNKSKNWIVVLDEGLARALNELIIMSDAEQNRDISQLIGLMKSSARINYMYREQSEEEGRNILVASIEDYENVHIIANQMVSESIGQVVPKGTEETFHALQEMQLNGYLKTDFEKYYTVENIMEYAHMHKLEIKGRTSIHSDIKALIGGGFVEQNPTKRSNSRKEVKPNQQSDIVYKRIYPTVGEVEEYSRIHNTEEVVETSINLVELDKLYPPADAGSTNPTNDEISS